MNTSIRFPPLITLSYICHLLNESVEAYTAALWPLAPFAQEKGRDSQLQTMSLLRIENL